MQLEKDLKELGLDDKEVNIYLAALELGKSSMSDLARKSGVNRATAYITTESLKNKGLLSFSLQKKKRLYIAAPPEKLGSLINEKQRLFSRLLPHLQSIDNLSAKKPKIQFFEGEKNLIDVYMENLLTKGEILTIAGPGLFHEGVLKYVPDYIEQRVKKRIPMKMIVPNIPIMLQWKERDVQELRQSKFVPHEKYPFKIQIDIYNKRVVLMSWEEKIALVIESADIADTLRSFYYLAWACIP